MDIVGQVETHGLQTTVLMTVQNSMDLPVKHSSKAPQKIPSAEGIF